MLPPLAPECRIYRAQGTAHPQARSNDFATAKSGQDPAHKLIVRSSLAASPNTELDITVRQLAALSLPSGMTPATGWPN
ncbi:MAG: hypothetical protein H7335_15215 [Massilia sp.]|nr:hypothetical protein [Massilia sp.]